MKKRAIEICIATTFIVIMLFMFKLNQSVFGYFARVELGAEMKALTQRVEMLEKRIK